MWGKRSIPALGAVGNNSGRHGSEGSFCGANKWTKTNGIDGGTLVFCVTGGNRPIIKSRPGKNAGVKKILRFFLNMSGGK